MSDSTEDEEPPLDPDHTPDLTNQRSVRRTRDRRLQKEREREAFWRAVLADKIGREELWRLIASGDEGHAFNTKHAAGPVGFPDERATWQHLGEQQMALRLYHDLLRIDLKGVALMHEEFDPRFPKPNPKLRG